MTIGGVILIEGCRYERARPPLRRQRRPAKLERPFPGTGQCCPKCHGGRVVVHDTLGYSELNFYGRQIATCADCRTAWEPVDESLVWDRSDARASFTEPCDNCAFRPGSPEQADTAKWKEMIASLRAGASFHCHKGVPLAPGSEHGFAYLQDADGKLDKRKLRPCRGYLNALGGEAIKGIASIFRNLAPTRAKLKPLVEAIETNGKLIEGWTERTKERQAELVKQVPAAAQTPAPGPVAAERLQRAQRRRASRHQRQKAEAVTARSPARSSAFSIH
jgi:hypothetical protein